MQSFASLVSHGGQNNTRFERPISFECIPLDQHDGKRGEPTEGELENK